MRKKYSNQQVKPTIKDGEPLRNVGKKREHLELLDFIKPGDIVFDVGCNTGGKTEEFLEKGAQVICVEPQPACVNLLKKKFDHRPDVQIVAKGLAAESGVLTLAICKQANVLSTFSQKWKTGRFANYQWDESVEVEMTTLDRLIDAYGRPKYCKIDVEGFEYQVLQGLSQPIEYVSFEFTFEFIDDAKRCISTLQQMGYKDFFVAEGESGKGPFCGWVGPDEIAAYLDGLDSSSLWGDIFARYCLHKGDGSGIDDNSDVALKSTVGNSVAKNITSEMSLIKTLVQARIIPAKGVIFDVGANMGAWTNGVLGINGHLTIHMFEPAFQNHRNLLKNIHGHLARGNVVVNNCAVGSQEEVADFFYYGDNPTWSTFYRRTAVEAEYSLAAPVRTPVFTTTLDNYCRRSSTSRIHFLKIDVEGAELDVLAGAKELFRKDKIDLVQFEYGGTFQDAGIKLTQVYDYLTGFGFLIFRLSAKGLEYLPAFLPAYENYEYANFLAVNGRMRAIFLKEAPAMIDLHRLCQEHDVEPRGVIHVGAHEGKEVAKYLEMGVRKILLIEANPTVYKRLLGNIQGKPHIQAVNCAITNKNGTVKLLVTSMDQSSSLLPLKDHAEIYPGIKVQEEVTIEAMTLDTLLARLGLAPHEFNLLNIDIQGAELLALQGAADTLKYIEAINTEVNFEELYEGCALIDQLDDFLEQYGFSRIATATPYHASWGDAFYTRRDVVTMATLGLNGRFANQIFQYAFLRIYAHENGLGYETPPWTGNRLFGCDNPQVSRSLPVVRERSNELAEALFPNTDKPFKNVDLWGYFQYHTSFYAPYKKIFRELFRPVPDIKAKLAKAEKKLRARGNTVVGLHLRRGDYGYGYFFVAPSQWYLEWLDGFWDTLDKPILFIASDEPEKVLNDFARYDPVTSRDLDLYLPEAECYPDFYLLSKCDVLAISNSSYSFAAAMLNERARFFSRPHLPTRKLISFDPWNSETIFRDATVEEYPMAAAPENNASRTQPPSIPPQRIIIKERAQAGTGHTSPDVDPSIPSPVTLLCFLAQREAYRPVIVSPREIFCGPDCETEWDGQLSRSIKTPVGVYDIAEVLQKLPTAQHPELLIVKADATGRNFPVNLDKANCKKLLIVGNTQHLREPLQNLIKYALQEKFDFVMSDHKCHHLHYFKEAGFAKVFCIPGFNNFPHEQQRPEEHEYQVSFVGQVGKWHPYRRHIIQTLNDKGIPLTVTGASHLDAASIYARSLINLNISLNGDLNLRVFEVLSSGGFLLTDKLSPESMLDCIFKDGEHFVSFENEQDLVNKIHYYLQHPEEAKAIACNGYTEYKRRHTPQEKIKELMAYLYHDEIDPLYRVETDKRSIYVVSVSKEELFKRVALYEFMQGIHLNFTFASVLLWPGVDARLACDLVDLPRLRLWIKNDGNDISPSALQLFENTGVADRIKPVTTAYLKETAATLAVVVLTAPELLLFGVKNLLTMLRFRWLVVADGFDSLPERSADDIRELLKTAGFEKCSDELEAFYWQDRSLWGEMLFADNQAAAAVRCFDEVLAEDPVHVNALNNLGVISFNFNKLESAEKFFLKAVSLDRRDLTALTNLAQVYLGLARIDEAATILREAVSLAEADFSLWLSLGYCREQQGDMDGALAAYQRVMELGGGDNELTEKIASLKETTAAMTRQQDSSGGPLLAPQRILVINNLYPPQELGGYGRLLHDFANILKARGHSVYVLTSDTPYLGKIEQEEPWLNRELELYGSWRDGVCKPIDDQKQIADIISRNHARVEKVIQSFSPDVCLLGNIDLVSPAVFNPLLKKKIPVIHHLGNKVPGYAVQGTPTSNYYHLASASNWLREEVLRQGYPLHDASVVYPGAFVNDFKMQVLPATDKLRIVYASIVLPYKGCHTLIDALGRLHEKGIDFSCSVAGTSTNPDYVLRLKEFVSSVGMERKVHFLGHLDREALKSCFAKHNVLVFPSVFQEPFGISQVEAMAAGLTVVTSGTGGAGEIVENGVSGLVFPAEDEKDLAQALLQLLEDRERWHRIAAAGQKRAMKFFDIERSADKLERKFAEMLQMKVAGRQSFPVPGKRTAPPVAKSRSKTDNAEQLFEISVNDLSEFLLIYNKSPIKNNEGGMKSPDLFSLYFLLKKIQPDIVIESGVWRGATTWLIRKAIGPKARIICLDPQDLVASKVKGADYYVGKGFVDFKDFDVSSLRGKILVIFDDHQNAMHRLIQSYQKNIQHIFFNDNYPKGCGSHLTLEHVLQKDCRTQTKQNCAKHKKLAEKIINRYFVFPNIIGRQVATGEGVFPCQQLFDSLPEGFEIFISESSSYRWNTYVEISLPATDEPQLASA